MINFGANITVMSLQTTKPKADGCTFVSFSKTRSAYVSRYKNKLKVIYTKPKSSRVNNICNLYLHVGKEVPKLWNSFKQTGNMLELSMGNIIIN